MQVSVGAGTYVVAVSGGVDSVVLLDLLMKQYGSKVKSQKFKGRHSDIQTLGSNRRFIVAHFDHGIRTDSAQDRKLVQMLTKEYGLQFIHESGHLGVNTSEAAARTARYGFLYQVMAASGARGIITAHHQDDLLETAILNLLRGSGRRGMTSLKSSEPLVRPLLAYSKDQLRDYAHNHSLNWREDPSNNDLRYRRNYIRAKILPKFSAGQRAQMLILIDELMQTNQELDAHIINLLHAQTKLREVDRGWFIHLPHDIAREVVHALLRRLGVRNLERKTVERLIIAMKTAKPGSKIDIDHKHILGVGKQSLALLPRDR